MCAKKINERKKNLKIKRKEYISLLLFRYNWCMTRKKCTFSKL